MSNGYENHGWRADHFSLISGRYYGDVARAWCADDSAADAWAWAVYEDSDGGCEDIVPDGVRQHGFTFAGAIAAVEAFIADRLKEEHLLRSVRFADVPANEECF